MAFMLIVGIVLIILFRIFNVIGTPQIPLIIGRDRSFISIILKMVPILDFSYTPTRLWGFNGHVQTILHSIIGRFKCPFPRGYRVELTLADDSLLTFDVYEPVGIIEDVTLAIAPGIGNSAESMYIQVFVHYALYYGYRCAVLNHIGVLSSVPVMSNRIFTYGYTGDFEEMVCHITEKYPETKIVLLGYSMGANIVTKYMGEVDKIKPPNIIGGISVCQGYDGIEGMNWLLNWQNFRRLYLYFLTESMKGFILKHRHILLSEESKDRYNLNERDILKAATLPELDDAYTRKVYGFQNVEELYNWSGCKNYLEGITHPMIFINSMDDPLVPHPLLEPIREFAMTHDNIAYIELAHGGHLGFYEGGLFYPNPVSWLDRSLVALTSALYYADVESRDQD